MRIFKDLLTDSFGYERRVEMPEGNPWDCSTVELYGFIVKRSTEW